jgi:hypothetical protein
MREWKASDLLRRGDRRLPRRRRENYWATEIRLRRRNFAATIRRIAGRLKRQETKLSSFVKNGGKIEIYLQLNGQLNAGDGLSPALLGTLAALGVDLQIEVFPKFA